MKAWPNMMACAAFGAVAAHGGITPAWLAYPGAIRPVQETCVVNRTCLSRIVFDTVDAPERVRGYYRCLFAAADWTPAGGGPGDAWRREDVKVSLAVQPRGPRHGRAQITVSFPVDAPPRAAIPDGVIPSRARTLASGVYAGGRSFALVECGDPPPSFLARAGRALGHAGWARHSGLELYRAHGVDESRLGWFVGREGQLVILAHAGGQGLWQYSLISTSERKGTGP